MFIIKDSKNNVLINISIDSLYFINSHENYVRIYYNSNDIISIKTVRVTLQSIIEQIIDKQIVRCHKSFVINLRNGKIENGFFVINEMGIKIPLSKKFQNYENYNSYIN